MGIFSKKTTTTIDPEQKELIEHAQSRIKQKKRLYYHFVFFLAAAILLIVMNLVLKIGETFTPLDKPWFVWALLFWCFILLAHLINVFVLGTFMNKKWEAAQIEKLVKKQRDRIAVLQEKIDTDLPLPEKKTQIPKSQTAVTLDPNTPQ